MAQNPNDHQLSIEDKITLLIQDRFLLLGSTSIKKSYEQYKLDNYHHAEAELTMAWLALLSGDNLGLYQRYQLITPSELSDRSLGLYYDLEALSGVFGSPQERLKKSKDAIEHLKHQKDLYLANAYLTHGQILNGLHHLREATTYFKEAYDIFFSHKLYFAASVSLTNALLDLYRLGDIDDVIELVEKTLLISSQFQTEDQRLWDIIRLPYGMCLLQKGVYRFAEHELWLAKEMIDHYELIHMHGYIEIELTRLFAILGNKHKLNHLYQQMVKLFSHMHYPMMDVILFYAKYHLNELETKDIEMIQFYDEHEKVLHPLINELMMVLHHDHKIDYPIDKHIKKIEEVRYTGDRIELITYLLFLADRYLEQGLKKEANVLIEEIYHLYQKHHLGLSMKLYDFKSSSLLKRIDSKLEFKKSNDHMLTDKELEILTWIEKGLTNDEISQKLFISIGTVKWHINHIYSKLEVKHRAECIKRAKDLKII
jgi:LuxR family maltose regulon positive regulatory protein